MKTYRKSIAVFLWICISALLIMILMKFRIPLFLSKFFDTVDTFFDSNKELATLTYDIFLGVFCSSIVVLFSTFIYYMFRKKKVIGLSRFYCCLYLQDLHDYIQCIFGVKNIIITDRKDMISRELLEELVNKISTDSSIAIMTKDLRRQRNYFIANINDFYPIIRKSKRNLLVCNLLQCWCDIHTVVEQCYIVYQIHNNIFFEQDYDKNIERTDLALKLNIFAQTDKEKLIEKFHEILKHLEKKYPPNKSKISKKCL